MPIVSASSHRRQSTRPIVVQGAGNTGGGGTLLANCSVIIFTQGAGVFPPAGPYFRLDIVVA